MASTKTKNENARHLHVITRHDWDDDFVWSEPRLETVLGRVAANSYVMMPGPKVRRHTFDYETQADAEGAEELARQQPYVLATQVDEDPGDSWLDNWHRTTAERRPA